MPPSSRAEPVVELATALLEDVTIGLCRQRTFAVFAPFTAWRLGSEGPEGDFVEKYGLDYVVQTRIQESGGDHFLTAKLLDANSRKIVWADRFAFRSADPRQSYQHLSHRIVASLSEEVANAEIDRCRREGDASSYVAYLLGTRALATLQLPGIRSARALFKTSIKHDRGFAPALGGLARTLHMEWLLLARGEPDLLHQAEIFSRRALAADPECADGMRELGLCFLYNGKFEESLGAFAEAERRNPQHADLLADYADALSLGGQPADALKKIEHATALNPLCPDHYRWYQGTIYYQLEQYEAAIDALSRMGDCSPAYKLIAASWAMLGEASKARDYTRKVLQIYPEFTVGKWLSMIPIRDVELRRHYEEGLRAAGFN
jgi:tetratricopeptide (TPR) repeat protein